MSSNFSKAYIFGAGSVGRTILHSVKSQYHVIAFLDNDDGKWSGTHEGLPVYSPESVMSTDYDAIVVATLAGVNSAVEQLLNLGVERSKIRTDYVDFTVRSRIVFLEKMGEMFHGQSINGCVAECGVFLGEFAREINRVFPTRKLYLFDTFSGFDKRDLLLEDKQQYSNFNTGHFSITSVETVLNNLYYPENCVFRKGYFPQTAEGLDESFCFVNLDFDLYQPTLAGLDYFFPRLVDKGIILVHDYFSNNYKGVMEAVKDFEHKTKGVRMLPIGDGLSMCIFRHG